MRNASARFINGNAAAWGGVVCAQTSTTAITRALTTPPMIGSWFAYPHCSQLEGVVVSRMFCTYTLQEAPSLGICRVVTGMSVRVVGGGCW